MFSCDCGFQTQSCVEAVEHEDGNKGHLVEELHQPDPDEDEDDDFDDDDSDLDLDDEDMDDDDSEDDDMYSGNRLDPDPHNAD